MTSSNNSAPARSLPDIARIDSARPFTWLARGWHDLWQQPGASLFYGVAMAVAGGFILLATARMPYLFTAAVSGFLLVAPLLATGLYDLSRSYGRGETASLYDSMCAWRRNTSPMIGFGMVSLLAGTLWQVMSVIIVAFFYRGGALEPMEMILTILRDPQHDLLFTFYIAVGGTFASLVFAVSVVSMPMLLDRPCELLDAISTSVRAVSENPVPMAVWATLIMLLTLLGFALALIGLVVILPWLGHATWHAYRDLVQ